MSHNDISNKHAMKNLKRRLVSNFHFKDISGCSFDKFLNYSKMNAKKSRKWNCILNVKKSLPPVK
jgi:hypothetical protein